MGERFPSACFSLRGVSRCLRRARWRRCAQVNAVDRGFHKGIAKVCIAGGHPAVLVPEEPLQAPLRHTAHRLVGSEGMPEIMQVEIFDARAFHGPAKGAADGMIILERKELPVDARRQ